MDGLVRPEEDVAQSQFQLDLYQGDKDMLDNGLDLHGLSEDDNKLFLAQGTAVAATPVDQNDTFFSLYQSTAEKLDIEWPSSPPAQKPLWLDWFYFPPKPAVVNNLVPLFPEFVSELEQTSVYLRHRTAFGYERC